MSAFLKTRRRTEVNFSKSNARLRRPTDPLKKGRPLRGPPPRGGGLLLSARETLTEGVGEVFIDGKQIAFGDPKKMLEQGFFLVTEDRKKLGLNLMMSLRENVTMPSLGKVSKHGVLNMDAEVRYSKKYLEDMHTKMPNIEVAANTLSGGNQQKVVLAKALMSEPKVMILDEPTRGIDVGAKYEIYKIMNELVDRGVVIIMISSEMEEIFGMSDRIIVLANGEITGELNAKEATQERVMQAAIGR